MNTISLRKCDKTVLMVLTRLESFNFNIYCEGEKVAKEGQYQNNCQITYSDKLVLEHYFDLV